MLELGITAVLSRFWRRKLPLLLPTLLDENILVSFTHKYFNCFALKYFTISHLLVCFSEFSRLSWRSLWISWRWDWMMFSLSCRTWPRRTCSLFRFPVKKYFLKHFPSLQQNIFCYENFNKNIFFSFLVLIINKTFACINLAKIANTKYSNPIIPPRPSELWRYQWR